MLFKQQLKILLLYLLLKKRKYRGLVVFYFYSYLKNDFVICIYSYCLKKENKKCVRTLNLLYYLDKNNNNNNSTLITTQK